MLFAKGQRPDADRLAAAIEAAGRLTVTHRFAQSDHPDTAGSHSPVFTGFELLRDGMTYDLTGLAPGPSVAIPPIRHRFGFSGSSDDLEAAVLVPGPHLAAGAHSIPVVRTQAGIAASLAGLLPGLVAYGWKPARTLVGADFFASSVSAWLEGGAFPSLGFTAFATDSQGGMVSEGLSWFTGQELRFSNDIAKDRANAARLGVRLVNQLVSQGRLTSQDHIIAPDGGRLALEPTRDGKTIRVRRA
ncbi:hypothetical protein N0B51_03695 [Tsuneonella sp. YG55]|uniref:Uncharacterized protein n=1 Tax=Tsuneonella litorea TaxID=2976475 RepID=A0A9X3AK94_9SPHN|nr:hypothetical protein [Tsuneonella litorea]MCT2558079.1 hypothetical protein [Tsuneonella litorea]